VGTGGGIPYKEVKEDPKDDIHLRDVVVGWAGPERPSVVQWDSGRSHSGRNQQISMLPPDRRIPNVLGY
jgi:hypothetical protein